MERIARGAGAHLALRSGKNAANKVSFLALDTAELEVVHVVEGLRKAPPGIRSSAISELFSSASDASFFDRAPNSPESSSAEEVLVFIAVCIVPRSFSRPAVPGIRLSREFRSFQAEANGRNANGASDGSRRSAGIVETSETGFWPPL